MPVHGSPRERKKHTVAPQRTNGMETHSTTAAGSASNSDMYQKGGLLLGVVVKMRYLLGRAVFVCV